MTAASSCPQPLYGHTNVPVRERRGALRQRPCSATDRSNPPKQGPAARSYISSNGTRTSTVPYTYVGVVVTTFTLSHHRWPLSRGPWAHTRHRGGPWANTQRAERSCKSTGGLIIEPSNAVHTTPTQDGPSHPPPPPPSHPPHAAMPPRYSGAQIHHPDGRPRSADHFALKASAGRMVRGGGASLECESGSMSGNVCAHPAFTAIYMYK